MNLYVLNIELYMPKGDNLKNFLFPYCLAVLGLRCCVVFFSSCDERGLLSSGTAWASHCSGFSC